MKEMMRKSEVLSYHPSHSEQQRKERALHTARQFLFLVAGSYGDCTNQLMTAAELKKAGAQVKIICPDDYRHLVESLHLEEQMIVLPANMRQLLDTVNKDFFGNIIQQFSAGSKVLSAETRVACMRTLKDAVQAMGGPENWYAVMGAIPYYFLSMPLLAQGGEVILFSPNPAVSPNVRESFYLLEGNQSRSRIQDDASKWMLNKLFHVLFTKSSVELYDAKLREPGEKKSSDLYPDLLMFEDLLPSELITADPSLFTVNEGRQEHVALTGYCFLPENYEFSDSQLTWFQEHPNYVVAGMGSLSPNPFELTAAIVRGAKAAGVPLVFLPGWGGLASPAVKEELTAELIDNPDVLILDGFTPYRQLARGPVAGVEGASLMITHGGAGAFHSSLVEGVPSAAVTHLTEQQIFVSLFERALHQNIGNEHPSQQLISHVSHKKITPAWVEHTIRSNQDETIREAFQQYGQSMEKNGTGNAVDALLTIAEGVLGIK